MAKDKKRKGSPLKVIIPVLIIGGAGVLGVSIYQSMQAMSGIVMAEVMPLEKKDIENTVSISGLVESTTFKKVSANLQYNVESVNVEVGDKVRAGDILATLNTDDLQDQIVQQQANIDSSDLSTGYSVSDAEKRYNDTAAQIADGTYSGIRSAQLTLDNAENALEKAKKNYNDQLELQGSDKDSQLVSAQKNVDSAKAELDYAKADYDEAVSDRDNENYDSIKSLKKAYDDAKKDYDKRYSSVHSNEIDKAREEYDTALSNYTYIRGRYRNDPQSVDSDALEEAQAAVTEKQAALEKLEAAYNVEKTEQTYDDALEAYNDAKADVDSANDSKVKSAKRAYERAQTTYDNALSNLEAVKNGNELSLESYEDAVNDAQRSVDDAKEAYDLAVRNAEADLASLKASADREKVLSGNNTQLISLEILKDKLNDCVITAPCDGTITSVNCTEGEAAVGTMFIIEDTDDLKMTASVKEYSVSQITPGLDVTVTIPSLDNKEFDGVVSSLAPAANKGADGKSDGTASYKVEILIRDTKDTGVLIGMNSKCTAVTGSAENVFAVGYDALVEDADGSCYVYTCDPIENNGTATGTATARKIPVEIGFESDAEIEIISDELYEGMDIITNSGDVTDGGIVLLADALGEAMQSAAE